MVQPSIIHRVESLKQELASLGPLSKEAEDILWRKLRLEWNYNSNHIEGNTLTYGETKLLLMFDKTTGDHSKREYDEMEAHDAAVLMVQEWAEDKTRTLTESDIRELNKVILVKPFWKEAITPDGQTTRRKIKIGEYKEHPNSVRLPNGEMFHYAKPEEVPIKMQELMDWYRSSSDLDPAVLAAELHYRFIRIHPFDDGNGRVARLLVNYVLMLRNLPPVVIKSAEKTKYLTALQKADVGDRDAFHTYMAEQLIWSLELTLKAAKGEDLEEDGDVDKKLSLLKRKVSGKGKGKSPKMVHQAYHLSEESLFRPILRMLESNFEDFFSETRIEKRIDENVWVKEKTSFSNIAFQLSQQTVPVTDADPKILGHSIYQLELNTAEWMIKLYGLKKSHSQTPISIKVSFGFNLNDYNISVELCEKGIGSVSGNYDVQLLPDDVQELIKSLKRSLVTEIERQVSADSK